MRDYKILDEALLSVAWAGPDLRNGLTNHGSMAMEALCAMGCGDAVARWLERYRKGMCVRPRSRAPISQADWHETLGRADRFADWRNLFERELKEASWHTVLDRWTSRLAPGISAAATHGVIRVGHAARSLADSETSPRIAELADGLALWAATYQELPTDFSVTPRVSRPRRAILKVPLVPVQQRKFTGTITSSLKALDTFSEFAPAIALASLEGDPYSAISELTATFARVFLANAHDTLSAIVFVHGVTSAAALRPLLPYLGEVTTRRALRYSWQAACGLYAAFGSQPMPTGAIEAPRESRDALADMAVANGDEHAIKFTEACLREHSLSPSPEYLAAARCALALLRE
jgi:Questin oxidase-like